MSARVAVLASGGGTNLQALLDAFHRPPTAERAAEVTLVVSDRPGAGALERADRAGVPRRVIVPSGHPESESAAELLDALEAANADVVALAGYLRRVPPPVVRRYRERMLNVHPALLPGFGGKGMYGMHVHRAVLAAGVRVTGVTVHLVDEEYDTGPILIQWPVPVLHGDTPEALAARVLKVEHAIYPHAVEAVARGASPGRGTPGGAAAGAAEAADELAFRLAAEAAPGAAEVRRLLGLE